MITLTKLMKLMKFTKIMKNSEKTSILIRKTLKSMYIFNKDAKFKLSVSLLLIVILMFAVTGCDSTGGGTKFNGGGGLGGNYKDDHSLDFMSDANIPFDSSKPGDYEGLIKSGYGNATKRAVVSDCIKYVGDPTMLTTNNTYHWSVVAGSGNVSKMIHDADLKYIDKWRFLAEYYKGDADCGGDYYQQLSRQVGYVVNFVRTYPNLFKEYVKAYKSTWSENNPGITFAILSGQGTDERRDGLPDVRQAWYDLEQNLNSNTPGSLKYPILYYSKVLEEISMMHSHGNLLPGPGANGMNIHVTRNTTIEGGTIGENAGARVLRYINSTYPNFIKSMAGENAYIAGFFTDDKDTLGAIRLTAFDIVFTYMIDPHQEVDKKTGTMWRGHAIGGVLGNYCSFGTGSYYVSAKERGVYLGKPTPVGPHQVANTIDFFSTCP